VSSPRPEPAPCQHRLAHEGQPRDSTTTSFSPPPRHGIDRLILGAQNVIGHILMRKRGQGFGKGIVGIAPPRA
jgi:hypothetical protein